MTSTNINVRTDGELKAKAQNVLNRLGMDMSTAINIYLVQIVEKKRDTDGFDGEKTTCAATGGMGR